jgi:hypothetical protein
VLFKQDILARIHRGEVKLAFRRWRRPSVQPGTQLHTAIGLLAIEQVKPIATTALTESSARAAGYENLEALFADLRPDGQLYRITFHRAGDDPRIALRKKAAIDDSLLKTLGRLDAAAKDGPWTERVLRLIAAQPGKRAADLSLKLSAGKERFKLNVRKLKNLGLTESLGTGYRISPRGRALLKRLKR